jgi:diguanylate cyclase (GGDEF)-like protein
MGLDPSAVNGEEAIVFWEHAFHHIAATDKEKAQCLLICAEHRSKLNQTRSCIDDLESAFKLLSLPQDIDDILTITYDLSERYLELGLYREALRELDTLASLAIEYSQIDEYALAILGMGNICDSYDNHERALRYYRKIDAIDSAINSRPLRLRYKLYKVACFISLNRYGEAMDQLKECEELAILVSDKILSGQIYLYRAQILRKQKRYNEALQTLGNSQYSANISSGFWLSNMMRLEMAQNFIHIGRITLAEFILSSTANRLKKMALPTLMRSLDHSLSKLYAQRGNYKLALKHEKRAYQYDVDLLKRMPITELGSQQLRKLSRNEPKLKLIVSEQENRELKEATESQKHKVAKLQQDVLTDPLTKLHNRRWLDIKLKDLIINETPFALLVVDIDHFKSINDELSHLVGDKAIQNVASQLLSHFRIRGSYCVRFGGEEFLVILEHTKLGKAESHADHYRERIAQFDWAPILGERRLTVSIGVTLHREGENSQRTFHRADKALYRAKANGRNQVCSES